MLNGKVILLTGGTGSFGKRFVEMTLEKYEPKKIIIYSRDELKQAQMKNAILEKYGEKARVMRYFIGDVRDRDRLHRAFRDVDILVHAAAIKRVEVCEYNPSEAIKTNVLGAQNVIDMALDEGIERGVVLSTDKAVNPLNLYGGTKLLSDKLFISANGAGPIFSVVRYGNVAASRGSIIHIFRETAAHGSKIMPITDLEMTRFWITLDQAVELVYKALSESKGGETYVSKIPSFKITDLARAISPDCEFECIGNRGGEKLHEIMVTKDDWEHTYEYDKHYIIYPEYNWWNSRDFMLPGGIQVERGFEYSSDKNKEWLGIEELKEELQRLGN